MALAKSILKVGQWGFWLLVVSGLVGGLSADLDGVDDHPAGQEAVTLASNFVRSALSILWNYPIGFVIGWVSLASVHWLFTHNHVQSLKNEYAESRRIARERGKGSKTTAKKSTQRNRPRRRRK